MNQPSSNGRLCCASSTGLTRPTSSSPDDPSAPLSAAGGNGRSYHPAPPA
jgi:hypothetical protein